MSPLPPLVRRTAIGAAGGSLVALGGVMLVTPGPGLLLVAAGVGLLGLEFETARRLEGNLRAAVGRIVLRAPRRRVASRADRDSPRGFHRGA